MADRNPALAVAFLFLVLMPQMAVSGKFPRFTVSPRTKKQLRNFFKDHASDMANLFPSQRDSTSAGGSSNDDPSEPGSGGGSNNGGRSQAAATTAGKYIYSFDVGTPPQRVSGALDISSELVWTQCACPDCGPALGTTLFDPKQSSTMAEVPCTSTTCQRFVRQTCGVDVPQCLYNYTYAGGMANTIGYLATETFAFDSDPVENVVFGCGLVSVGEYLGGVSGVIGLSRSPFSLVSQLQAGRFSYYFAPDDSVGTESFIDFGDDATPRTRRALSTPLLANSAYPNLYYVGLSGIQVDGKDLAIPRGTFDLVATDDGSGGVILSITVPVTFLDEVAYKVLRAALVSKINLPTVDGSLLGLDLCYTSESLATATIPAMALVFDGGAVMELETWNYFYMDAVTGLECLAIIPSTAGGGSLLGNLIQAGTHMIYDIRGSTLMFESLEQPPSSTSGTDTSDGKGSPRRSSSAPSLRTISPVVAVNLVWVYMLYWAVAF